MAKVVDINTDAESFVRSVKLLFGKTRNDGERMIERPVYKIVLLKESEIWFPGEDAKCQDGLISCGERVAIDTV